MFDVSYEKNYKEFLETSLEKIPNLDDKISYLEKSIFEVNMIDHWNEYDRFQYDVLTEKKRELMNIKNK